MNIEQLSIFINLAENLSFTQTALKLNMSQSAVSQNISKLENQLGFKLFIRNRRTVNLTKSGQIFYINIKPLINIYYKAQQEAQRANDNNQTDLSIGYSGTPWEIAELPKIIKQYKNENPAVKIFLEIHSHENLKQRLSNGDLDIIFTMPDIVRHMSNLHYINLTNGHYVISIPKNENYFFNKKIYMEDLDFKSIIFLDTQWLPTISINLQKKISKLNKNMDITYANNITAENAMVQSGLALGLWCNFVTDPNDSTIYTKPLKTDLKPRYGIAVRKDDNSKAVLHFINWIKKKELTWN